MAFEAEDNGPARGDVEIQYEADDQLVEYTDYLLWLADQLPMDMETESDLESYDDEYEVLTESMESSTEDEE